MSKFEDDERFDGLYLNVAQTTRGIEPLLDTVFGFLRRKTDFFAGPPGATTDLKQGTAVALQKVQDVLKKHADLYEKEHAKKTTTSSTTTKKQKASPSPNKQAPAAAKKEEEQVLEMGTDGGFDISEATSKPTATTTTAASPSKVKAAPAESKPVPPVAVAVAAAKDDDTAADKKKAEPKEANNETTTATTEDDDDDEKKKRDPPPIGNGGTVEGKYVWTQTLSEVNMTIPVPESTRGRDLNVVIAKKHLKVGLLSAIKKNEKDGWLINTPLTKPIICDDSFWTVEDGNRLVINLQKSNDMEWWETVCEGDTKINIQAIQPETSSLSDLDGETRQTVEKMMVDQRQKALGLPSTDEMQKLAMLEKFKAQHPEMDFSNAKFG